MFKEKAARFYAASVISCFEYLHEHSIIYRDLKPENLMLDSDGYLKMIDFGFAKVINNRTNTLCGTPEYLAPEIILGKGHNRAVDWWTVGVLIFEMLACYPPFTSKKPVNIYKKIVEGRIVFPRHVTPTARDLISQLLRLKPDLRIGMTKGGVKDIKNHPWFEGFDWDALYNGTMVPPYFPPKKHPSECGVKGGRTPRYNRYLDDGSGWDDIF